MLTKSPDEHAILWIETAENEIYKLKQSNSHALAQNKISITFNFWLLLRFYSILIWLYVWKTSFGACFQWKIDTIQTLEEKSSCE